MCVIRGDAVHVHLLLLHRSAKGGGGGGRTDQVGVVRRQFIVQLDGVRLIDGIPERLSASDDAVDVFRVGIPEERQRRVSPSARRRAAKLEQMK
jgi:hypothetical protein